MIANSCIAGIIVDVLTTGRADISAANSNSENAAERRKVAERESPRSAQEKGSFVLVFLLTVVCERWQNQAVVRSD